MKDQYIDTTKMFWPGEPKKSWLALLFEKIKQWLLFWK